jgi:hypothetical protein
LREDDDHFRAIIQEKNEQHRLSHQSKNIYWRDSLKINFWINNVGNILAHRGGVSKLRGVVGALRIPQKQNRQFACLGYTSLLANMQLVSRDSSHCSNVFHLGA